jgi:HK97 family phage major capsid protein
MTEAQKALEEAKKKAAAHPGYMPGDVQEAATKAVAEAMAKQAEAFKAEKEKADMEKNKADMEAMKARLARYEAAGIRKMKFGTGPDVAPGWVAGVALDEQTKAAQRAHDELLTMAHHMAASKSMPLQDAMKHVVEVAKQSAEYGSIIKAMAETSGQSGDDWTWVEYSRTFIQRVELEAKVAGLCLQVPMVTPTQVIPAIGTRPNVYLLSEPTSDTESNITATTPGDGKITLTSKIMGGMVWISDDLEADALGSVASIVTSDIVKTLARSLDQAITDGDATGAHFDDDVTSSTDPRKGFDGMIAHAITGSDTLSLNTFTADNLRALRALMGVYGINPAEMAWISGLKTLVVKFLNLKDSNSNPMVTTMAQLGPNATILNGQLGQFDGIPIVVSETMREDVSATGVHSGTAVENLGRLLLVYRPGFIVGNRSDVTVKAKPFEERAQLALIFRIRKAIQAAYSATDPISALGYNIAYT